MGDKVLSARQIARQTKYAAYKALNEAAFDIRGALVAELPSKFTIRTQWTEKGFRVRKATKSSLRAIIGNTREYLADHVKAGGATRVDKAIPTPKVRRKKQQRVSRSRWPSNLQGPRYVLMDARKDTLPRGFGRHQGRRERLLFRRPPAGRKRGLRLLWVIPSRLRLRRRWNLRPFALSQFRERYPRLFQMWLAKALADAR